jgi:hypothetical protein
MTPRECTTDIVSARTEARHWLQVRVGEQPLVPDEVAGCGAPSVIIAAAHARLAQLRALQSARVHGQSRPEKPHSGRYNAERQ